MKADRGEFLGRTQAAIGFIAPQSAFDVQVRHVASSLVREQDDKIAHS